MNVISNYDQNLSVTVDDLKLFEQVDQVIRGSITVGDPYIALNHGASLIRSGMMRGLALAKLFSELDRHWPTFQEMGWEGELSEIVYEHTGRSPETLEKYIRVWRNVFENQAIPPGVRSRLMGMPMETLLLVQAAAREGDLNEQQWNDVSAAPDKATVRQIIREARGEVSSSNTAVLIQLLPDGTLRAKQGDGEWANFGWLNEDTKDPACDSGIARIIRTARIMEVE